MKQLLTIILFFVSIAGFAQADTLPLNKAIANLNIALLKKDTVLLKSLIDDKLNYGHSNGWIQSNRSIVEDLYNGKITYNKIDQTAPTVVLNGNVASVRATADIDVDVSGTNVKMRLTILQVWVLKNKRWLLFTRQSGKL
jgi:hypothetical protein